MSETTCKMKCKFVDFDLHSHWILHQSMRKNNYKSLLVWNIISFLRPTKIYPSIPTITRDDCSAAQRCWLFSPADCSGANNGSKNEADIYDIPSRAARAFSILMNMCSVGRYYEYKIQSSDNENCLTHFAFLHFLRTFVVCNNCHV